MKKIVLFLMLGALAMSFSKKTATEIDNRLKFEYSIQVSEQDKNTLIVTGKITNKSNETIYYLSESCRGVKDYVIIGSKEISKVNEMECFVNFMLYNSLKPNQNFTFKTMLKRTNENAKINLKFKFVELKKDLKLVEHNRIHNYKLADRKKVVYLDGEFK